VKEREIIPEAETGKDKKFYLLPPKTSDLSVILKLMTAIDLV
jgi:hypothetical protein